MKEEIKSKGLPQGRGANPVSQVCTKTEQKVKFCLFLSYIQKATGGHHRERDRPEVTSNLNLLEPQENKCVSFKLRSLWDTVMELEQTNWPPNSHYRVSCSKNNGLGLSHQAVRRQFSESLSCPQLACQWQHRFSAGNHQDPSWGQDFRTSDCVPPGGLGLSGLPR